MRVFHTAIVVALFVLLGCSAGSPTAPSSENQDQVTPKPAAGTQPQSISLPGTSTPFIFWIEKMDPENNGQMTVGKQAYVTWTGSGPGGYSAYIKYEYLFEGIAPKGPHRSNGSSVSIGKNSVGIGTFWLEVQKTTPNVVGIRWYVWVMQGHWPGTLSPTTEPDVVITQTYIWRRAPE